MTRIGEKEAERVAEQARLDSLKTSEERNRIGQFATPPALAESIARYALGLTEIRSPIRFLEPAVGTGAFFSALLRCASRERIGSATGVELDPAMANCAASLWHHSGLDVKVGDFTTMDVPRRRFNLILTNPPYVRHHHLTADEKTRLRAIVERRLGIRMSGLAGLYCYFLLLAHDWMEEDGVAAWLIPSEFMDVNYGTALKEYLTDRVSLLRIHRFQPSDVQFDDALVSSAIVVFRRHVPAADHAVMMTLGGPLDRPAVSEHVPLNALRETRKWTGFPSRGQCTTGNGRITLSELFDIKRGLATGSNSFFVLPRRTAQELEIPPEFLRPILPSPRYLREVVIEARDDGYPRIENPLSLIDCALPEEELARKHPRFYEYLAEGRRQNIHTGYLASRRVPWYSQEKRPPAPFLCTYMGRTGKNKQSPFRVLWNKSQATAANVYLLMYPKGVLRERLAEDPGLLPRVFEALQGIEAAEFLAEGRVYGGGLHKVEPAELGRLPADVILASVDGMKMEKQRRFAFL